MAAWLSSPDGDRRGRGTLRGADGDELQSDCRCPRLAWTPFLMPSRRVLQQRR
jgi:hypothetical protein